MLILCALVLLCAIPLAHGLLFAKFGAVKRISTVGSPHGHVHRTIVARAQHHADEGPFDNSTVDQVNNHIQSDPANARQLSEEPEPVAQASIDHVSQAIADYEKVLTEELQQLETMLRSERAALTKLRDKVSESGKNGFFIVQAQVNDFTVRLNNAS